MSILQVTKIIEGGVDLTTGEELPRCIVVSNGYRNHEIPISDANLQALLIMYGEVFNTAPEEVQEIFEEPKAEFGKTEEPTPPNPGPVIRVVRSEDAEPPPSTDRSTEGFEAGEEYNDSGTGIGSL